jgi:hypothetical protein
MTPLLVSKGKFLNPLRAESASKFDNLKNNLTTTIIKYYLEEYFGIDAQSEVIDFEFWFLSLHSNSPVLSPIFYYKP